MAYNKSSKRKSKYAIGAPKGKTPSRSCNLRKGVLFSAYGLPKPLPLGEVSPKVTERASPARKSRCAAMGRLFVRAILSLCQSCLVASLPSQALRASSPRGGATGVSVSFRLDAESPTGRKRAGPATEGSGFWISAPCQAAAGLDSGALPFPRHRALLVQHRPDRHAKASPR